MGDPEYCDTAMDVASMVITDHHDTEWQIQDSH